MAAQACARFESAHDLVAVGSTIGACCVTSIIILRVCARLTLALSVAALYKWLTDRTIGEMRVEHFAVRRVAAVGVLATQEGRHGAIAAARRRAKEW